MMFLDTTHKKKSFTLTSVLLIVVLILFFYVGLSYMVPPPETGIAINFGRENTGGKAVLPKETVKQTPEQNPQPSPDEELPVVEKTEDMVTGNEKDAPVIPVKKEKKPSKAIQDALSKILKGAEANGNTEAEEGDDRKPGDKGQPQGDPYANTYYGNVATGSGVQYGLKGRAIIATGKVQQKCNEEGKVVVKIEVNKDGKVVSAIPGVKGTTNKDPCLLVPAKETALLYRWNVDAKAPLRQIGFVVINFKLGE